MKRLQGFQYELQPNGEERRNMRRFAESCRFVRRHWPGILGG
ncbi:MAG: helix-turn-helix domain-containing protein [Azonexus sp.]|nr:helix-turn-helix domain-containing protein [Azonexus sp.]